MKRINLRLLWIFGVVVILTFAASVTVYHAFGYFYACHPGFDFLIHQESFNSLSTFESFNPFVISQNIKIFNDHFDPIIFLGIPFVKIFKGHPWGHFLFQAVWFWGIFIFLFFKLKDRPKVLLLSLFMVVFSGGLLSGLTFPLHPMTWSMLPLIWLCYSIKKKDRVGIIILACLLCFFKETFPYGSFLLGVWYFFRKNYKTSIPIVLFAASYLFFLIFFRESFVGTPFPYKDVYLNPLLENPLERILFLFKTLDYKSWFYLIYPLAIPLFLVFKWEVWGKKWWKKDEIIPAMIYLIPFIGIHFLSNIMLKWNRVTFTSIFLGIIIFSSIFRKLFERRVLLSLIIIFTILGSSRYYTRIFKLLVLKKSKSCVISENSRRSLTNARKIINAIDKTKVIVATSGFIPWANRVDRILLPAGGNSAMPERVDYLVLQRNGAGYTVPWSIERVENTMKICKGKGYLYSDKFAVVIEGPFVKDCMDYISYNWNTREIVY
ncbi:MAG: DUF2079 domain-containing protein [Bacteriovoracaceae bacterium]|nr:DUF2079 domain-containing protein [Bacteriovoracaceae bacterium]